MAGGDNQEVPMASQLGDVVILSKCLVNNLIFSGSSSKPVWNCNVLQMLGTLIIGLAFCYCITGEFRSFAHPEDTAVRVDR